MEVNSSWYLFVGKKGEGRFTFGRKEKNSRRPASYDHDEPIAITASLRLRPSPRSARTYASPSDTIQVPVQWSTAANINVLPHQLIPDESANLIDAYLDRRVERRAERWAEREQDLDDFQFPMLVILLRGLPGAGKTMFAMGMGLYAHARQLRTMTCSADTFFETPDGYRWDRNRLHEAHDRCFQQFVAAVNGLGTDVVIVDNTNIRHQEFQRYQHAAEALHYCQFVSFHCDSLDEARWQASRSLHNVPDDVIVTRFGEYHRANTQMRGIWIEPAILEANDDQEERARLRREVAEQHARLLAQAEVERQRQLRRDQAAEEDRRWRAQQI